MELVANGWNYARAGVLLGRVCFLRGFPIQFLQKNYISYPILLFHFPAPSLFIGDVSEDRGLTYTNITHYRIIVLKIFYIYYTVENNFKQILHNTILGQKFVPPGPGNLDT